MVSMHLSSFAVPVVVQVIVTFYQQYVMGQQFRAALDLLWKEDLSVGLSFATSNTEIFLAK